MSPPTDQPVLIVISDSPAVVASVPCPHWTRSGTWTSAPNIAALEKNPAAEAAAKTGSAKRRNGRNGSAERRSAQTNAARPRTATVARADPEGAERPRPGAPDSSTTSMRPVTPARKVPAPARSRERPAMCFPVSRRPPRTRAMTSAPSGRFRRKIQRQLQPSTMTPPRRGPAMLATPHTAVMNPCI